MALNCQEGTKTITGHQNVSQVTNCQLNTTMIIKNKNVRQIQKCYQGILVTKMLLGHQNASRIPKCQLVIKINQDISLAEYQNNIQILKLQLDTKMFARDQNPSQMQKFSLISDFQPINKKSDRKQATYPKYYLRIKMISK